MEIRKKDGISQRKGRKKWLEESSKLRKVIKEDLEYAFKGIKKLKMGRSMMYFPDKGDFKEWKIEAYGDADCKSLPDDMLSCRR